MSPKPELNAGAKEGKFRYDRDFLLQFMSICKEKPESLPPLDAIGLEPVDQLMLTRGGSGRHRQISGTSVPSRQASIAGGIPGAGLRGQFQSMGSFTTSSSKFVPGGERFDSAGNRSVSMSGASMSFRNAPLQRTASQGGPGPMQSHRTRSKRGEKRPDSKSGVGGGPQAHGPPFEPTWSNGHAANQISKHPCIMHDKAIEISNVFRQVFGLPLIETPTPSSHNPQAAIMAVPQRRCTTSSHSLIQSRPLSKQRDKMSEAESRVSLTEDSIPVHWCEPFQFHPRLFIPFLI
ncbi:hypothetical protein AX17_004122 [Amanita inopinata Kibby_2008]|nr:hypothetical protein AX17_004122 [Amanita inopinata Kibby_2008]